MRSSKPHSIQSPPAFKGGCLSRSITRIILSYAAFSAAWILVSDFLVSDAFNAPIQVLFLSVLKGLLFIIVTSCLLFLLLRRYLKLFATQEAALLQSQESLTRVLAGSQLGFWDWNIVTNEVKRNAIWAEMLGYSFNEIEFTTQQWTNFVHPDDQEIAWTSINDVLAGRKTEHELIYRMKTKDGQYKWILDRARVVQRDDAGNPLRMSGTHTDVDKLKKIEDALHESEQRFRSIFEFAGVGIAQVTPEGEFLLINDTFCRIAGYSRDELLYRIKNFKRITYPDDLDANLLLLQRLLDGTIDHYNMEKRYIRPDGSIAWVHLSVSLLKDNAGYPTSVISAVQDISDLKHLQKELEIQAHTDYLTGIPNRRCFMELAEHELAKLQRYDWPLAAIMVDVDFFKNVNDLYGHKAGDLVLQKIAQLMKDVLRDTDLIGRIGGEEFAILLPQTDKPQAIEVAERLQCTVANTEILLENDLRINVTISIGIAMFSADLALIDSLLKKADQGLYRAKAMGRNKIVCC